MPVFPLYINQSIDLTGFYTRTTLAFNRCISPYSVRMRQNTDQKNSEYEHFSCSDRCTISQFLPLRAQYLKCLQHWMLLLNMIGNKEFQRQQSWTKHLQTFSLLAQFVHTTSEMELDYHHQKVNVRVASRVSERLMTQEIRKLRSFKKITEMFGFNGEYPAVHPKVKF